MYLETFILKDTFDGGILTRRGKLSLEDDTERAIADDFTLSILKLSGFASHSILDAFTDYFCKGISRCADDLFALSNDGLGQDCSPPIRKLLNAPGRCDDILQISGPIGDWNTIGRRRETTSVVYQGDALLWRKPCWAARSSETRVKLVRCDATYASELRET